MRQNKRKTHCQNLQRIQHKKKKRQRTSNRFGNTKETQCGDPLHKKKKETTTTTRRREKNSRRNIEKRFYKRNGETKKRNDIFKFYKCKINTQRYKREIEGGKRNEIEQTHTHSHTPIIRRRRCRCCREIIK